MNWTRPKLLAIAFLAVAFLPSCLSPAQQAKLARAEQVAAGIGDKLLKIGVLTGEITPEEAAAARTIGKIIVTPAPVPATEKPELTAPKNPVDVSPEPLASRAPLREAVDLRADAPTGPPKLSV